MLIMNEKLDMIDLLTQFTKMSIKILGRNLNGIYLHGSAAMGCFNVEKMNGTDKDLAAHITIINHYGVVLYGAAIESVFSEVHSTYYIDSIWDDVKDAKEYITSNFVYVTLNLCRVYVE